MPFVKDESGTPAGRPPGASSKAALPCMALIDAEGESLTRQVIARAHEGDAAALRLCLDRVLRHGSDRLVLFPLPRIESPKAAREAVGCLTAAIGTGELTPREATDLLRVVERGARALAAAEAAARARGDDSPDAVAGKLAAVDLLSAPGEDKAAQHAAPAAAHDVSPALPPGSGSNPALDVLRGARNKRNNGNTMKQDLSAVPPAAHANGRVPESPGVLQKHVPIPR